MTKSSKKASTLPTARNRTSNDEEPTFTQFDAAADDDDTDPPPLPPPLNVNDTEQNLNSAKDTAVTASATPAYVATAAAIVDPSMAAAAEKLDNTSTASNSNTTNNDNTSTTNTAPPIDALANAAIEAAEADRIAKLKAATDVNMDDDVDMEMHTDEQPDFSIVSAYKITDPEFMHIESLYKSNQIITSPASSSSAPQPSSTTTPSSYEELSTIDKKIRTIIDKINKTNSIQEISTLSAEADKLEQLKESIKVNQVNENKTNTQAVDISRIRNARKMAKQASEYWLKEKRNFKRFGEWKIVLNKIDTVYPMGAALENDNGDEKDNNYVKPEPSSTSSTNNNNIFPTDPQQIQNLYQPSNKKIVPAPRKAKVNKAKEDRLRQKRDWKFIPEATFKFYLQGGQKGMENLEGNGFEWRNGYIYCTICDSFLKRPVDMKQHIKSARHQRRINDYKESTESKKDEIENIFERILNDDKSKKNEQDSATAKPLAASAPSISAVDAEGTTNGNGGNTEGPVSESGTASNSMANEVAEYWLNHKQDIKKFLEWKMMQKMTTQVLPSETSEAKSDPSSNVPNLTEMEIANRMVEGFHEEEIGNSINPPPSKKLLSMPNPKASNEPKRLRPKVAKDNRQRQEREWKFIPESTYKFYLQGGKLQNESLEGNGIEWNNGYIQCIHCETYIKRPVDMKQHCKSGRHQNKLRDQNKPNQTSDAALKIPGLPLGTGTDGDIESV